LAVQVFQHSVQGTLRTVRPRALLAIACIAAIALAAAPQALASSVTISGGSRLNVSAAGNERNDFSIRLDTGTDAYLVSDAAGITANGACDPVNPDTATCPAAGIGSITINAGGGSDQTALDAATIPTTVEADLDGGTGNDRLFGSGAADALDGDSGNDILDGGPGADDLRGGSGADVLSYTSRPEPLFITIGSVEDNDGGATDQTASRRDTVRGDIEQVLGGAGADTMFGDGSADTLVGGGGGDRLFGLSSGDHLDGGIGNDRLSGGHGGDRLFGGADSDAIGGGAQGDLLSGGGGNDILVGKKGVDAINGKAGIDRINAHDRGRDHKINCGSGPNRRESAKRDKRLDPRGRSC
jgi:Ca2+-binding RTX toxin-like protein